MIGPMFNEDSLASGRKMPNVRGVLPVLLVYLGAADAPQPMGGYSAHTEESSFGGGVEKIPSPLQGRPSLPATKQERPR